MMKSKHPAKAVLAAFLAVLTAVTLLVPASASQKLSNPGDFSGIDGIAADPNVGMHNSYAWCTEVFSQTDADYLWVGMNRDMGSFLIGNANVPNADDLLDLAGLPPLDKTDRKGKIYRVKCADNDAEWELMYENPAIAGWRRMLIFNGDLYVLAGLTNLLESNAYFYSVIMRFPADFEQGDTPDIVFWEVVPTIYDLQINPDALSSPEYFRSATILDGKLYIGTFDCKIYVTDGTGLGNQTTIIPPNMFASMPAVAAARHAGWTLFKNLKEDPLFESTDDANDGAGTGFVYIKDSIWDMIGFKGSLYAFCIHLGFRVYKINPADGSMKVIVGDNAAAAYPPGMGMTKSMSGSGFLSTSFGKDYVYVSTFANGPGLMGNIAAGKMDIFHNQQFCPSQIYRFDASDKWEAVVADTSGEFAPRDKAGNVIQRIGNQRSGFHPGSSSFNPSLNQYIWWMAEHEGKLYASTWDMGIYKNKDLFILINTILGTLGEDAEEIVTELLPYAYGPDTPVSTIVSYFFQTLPITFRVIRLLFQKRVVMEMIPLAWNSIRVFFNKKNPGGFDLFVSEDGKDFQPVTMNGFGNEENYGGRVLLPSAYGLILCSANPYGGGQVWRVGDIQPALTINAPASIEVAVGESVKVSVQAVDLSAAVTLAAPADAVASASLVNRSGRTIYDYNGIVSKSPFGKYTETYTIDEYNSEMYDILITGVAAGTETLTFTVTSGSITATRTIEVSVT